MKKIKTLAWHVLPKKGLCLIKNVPAYEMQVDGLKLALAKIRGKWGVYDPESGMSGTARFKTLGQAKETALQHLAQPETLRRAKEQAGKFYKTTAALEIGNFIDWQEI